MNGGRSSDEYVPVRVHWRYGERSGVYVDVFGVPLYEGYDPAAPIYLREPDPEGYHLDEYGLNTFIWREGNYSCDCNRASFFGIDDNMPCGDTIEVTKIERVVGLRSAMHHVPPN